MEKVDKGAAAAIPKWRREEKERREGPGEWCMLCRGQLVIKKRAIQQ